MNMRFIFRLLLIFCWMPVIIRAQDNQLPSLEMGDPAPLLTVGEWLKGIPVERFEKGRVYILEFWATWCAPCRAAMPRLSTLASEYKDRVTIIGIDIMERKSTPIEKVKAFVDSMGNRMSYHVATDDNNFMVDRWIDASGEQPMGIPRTFVVNAEGRLAWIGHPKDLPGVLPKILNKEWDMKKAAAKRREDEKLRALDDSLNFDLMNYSGDYHKQDYTGKPDSALLAIRELVRNEPKLQYAPFIANHTFSSLLKTNQQKAYEYGKMVLVTPTYTYPAFDIIIGVIDYYSNKLKLSPEIYRLGAEAYQAQIDAIAYPELINLAKYFNKMAEWYGCANDKLKAIEAQDKAIEALKSKKELSVTEMAAFRTRLQHYKNM